MTLLQIALRRACQDLGLKIAVPFVLSLRSGLEIHAQALLPQLGAERGMIVVNRLDELKGVESELVNIGYGYSVLDEPSASEEYELDSYVDMFSDWGWGLHNEPKPGWMS